MYNVHVLSFCILVTTSTTVQINFAMIERAYNMNENTKNEQKGVQQILVQTTRRYAQRTFMHQYYNQEGARDLKD